MPRVLLIDTKQNVCSIHSRHWTQKRALRRIHTLNARLNHPSHQGLIFTLDEPEIREAFHIKEL